MKYLTFSHNNICIVYWIHYTFDSLVKNYAYQVGRVALALKNKIEQKRSCKNSQQTFCHCYITYPNNLVSLQLNILTGNEGQLLSQHVVCTDG